MTDKKTTPETIRPALLIIDVQNRFLPMVSQRDMNNSFYFINLLVSLFRKHGLPIIRIYHQDPETGPVPQTHEFEYPDTINTSPDDIQVIKNYSDSFNKTGLDEILRYKNCNTLFLCGLSAVGCVLATKTGAQNHDFKPFIVKDAIMSHNSEYTRNVEIMFDAISYDAVELIVRASCSEH